MFRIRKYVYHNCNTNRGEFNTVDLRNRRSNRNFQTSPTFSVPGTYTVSIKDKNGYNGSITYVYPLTAAAVVTKTLDCSGSPDAVITTITGGRAPFTYTVQKEAEHQCEYTKCSTTFTTTVSNANADTYTFITDANGCTTTIATTVAPITDPTVTATQSM
jgi:hypothetical protein